MEAKVQYPSKSKIFSFICLFLFLSFFLSFFFYYFFYFPLSISNIFFSRYYLNCSKHVKINPSLVIYFLIALICFDCKRTGVGRLVCVTSIYVQKDPSNPRWMDWIVRPLLRACINDMILMENIVMKSNICYTIVRPPNLIKGTFRP